MPPEDFIKVKTRFYRRSSAGGEQDEEDDDLDEDDVGEDEEEEMMETVVDQGPSTSNGGQGSSPTPSPDTPAANKLLQFCAQVANQMGQVMPTQG